MGTKMRNIVAPRLLSHRKASTGAPESRSLSLFSLSLYISRRHPSPFPRVYGIERSAQLLLTQEHLFAGRHKGFSSYGNNISILGAELTNWILLPSPPLSGNYPIVLDNPPFAARQFHAPLQRRCTARREQTEAQSNDIPLTASDDIAVVNVSSLGYFCKTFLFT